MTPLSALASSTHTGSVPIGTTIFFAAILVAMIVCLALEEKIHAKKSIIVAVFAAISLLLGQVFGLEMPPPVEHMPVYIPAIEWEVIAIILGSSLFVDVTSRSGLFTYIAIRLTKRSGGDPLLLLIYYGVMTVLFSAFLNNVTAMIIVGSLTAVSLKKLGRNDKLLGFLLIEGLLTNIGGLLTLISSVPNIIVGSRAGISFVDFFLVASPYVIVATAATLFLGARVFKISRLAGVQEVTEARELVEAFDENDGIESRRFFYFAAIIFVCFIGTLASTSVLPFVRELGMGYVALGFAVILLVRYKHEVDTFYRAVDWDLLAFFAGLFIVIAVMGHAQVLARIGDGVSLILGLGEVAGSGVLLASSALASSVTDNIPLSAMLAQILQDLGQPADSPNWWAVVFGCNLGGNLTPIGSASTLVAVTIIHRNKLKMTFGGFIKAALPFAVMHIGLAVIYVLVFLT